MVEQRSGHIFCSLKTGKAALIPGSEAESTPRPVPSGVCLIGLKFH